MIDPAPRDAGRALRGLRVTNQDAERLGTVRSVLVDARSRRPTWVLVERGRLRKRTRPVPLAEALVGDAAIVVPYSADDLRLAPEHAAGTPLSAGREQQLVDHYNLGFGTAGTAGPHTGVPAVGARITDTAGAVPADGGTRTPAARSRERWHLANA